MSIIMEDRDELQEVVEVLAAHVGDAEYMAVLTARVLDQWYEAWGRKTPLPLPLEFLLELSAVIRIAVWQHAGLTDAMGAGFPAWQELLEQLLARLFNDPTSFSCDPLRCPAPLSKRVTSLWFNHCSWTATSLVGTDIVVHAVDEELLLDALADVLWKHRHLIRKERAYHNTPEEE